MVNGTTPSSREMREIDQVISTQFLRVLQGLPGALVAGVLGLVVGAWYELFWAFLVSKVVEGHLKMAVHLAIVSCCSVML